MFSNTSFGVVMRRQFLVFVRLEEAKPEKNRDERQIPFAVQKNQLRP